MKGCVSKELGKGSMINRLSYFQFVFLLSSITTKIIDSCSFIYSKSTECPSQLLSSISNKIYLHKY